MHQQVVFGDAIFTNRDYFRMRAIHANALVALLSENHRLAVFEIEHAIGTDRALREIIERMIVEDVAVLIDLDERNALVLRCASSTIAPRCLTSISIERATNVDSLAIASDSGLIG